MELCPSALGCNAAAGESIFADNGLGVILPGTFGAGNTDTNCDGVAGGNVRGGNLSFNASTRGQNGLSGRLSYQKGRVTLFGGTSLSLSGQSFSNSDLRQNLIADPAFLRQDTRSDRSGLFTSADFETRYEERRPFFVEGSHIYQFAAGPGGLLYTRRIGADAPIIGAAKLSGRTANGLSFGVLGATTGDDLDPTRSFGQNVTITGNNTVSFTQDLTDGILRVTAGTEEETTVLDLIDAIREAGDADNAFEPEELGLATGTGVGAAALLAACGSSDDRYQPKDGSELSGNLAISGLNSIVCAAPFAIAAEKFYADAKVTSKNVHISGGTDTVRAILNDSVGGSAATISAILAYQGGARGLGIDDVRPIIADTSSLGYTFLTGGSRATAREPDRREWIFAAIHRGHGTWTHLYLVVESAWRGRPEIHLRLTLEGERLEEARRRAVASWWRPVGCPVS